MESHNRVLTDVDRIAEIEALLRAATPGPWYYDSESGSVGTTEYYNRENFIADVESNTMNGKLIARAPSDLRFLLDRVAWLEKELVKYQQDLNEKKEQP